jgi:hypothetical protein
MGCKSKLLQHSSDAAALIRGSLLAAVSPAGFKIGCRFLYEDTSLSSQCANNALRLQVHPHNRSAESADYDS